VIEEFKENEKAPVPNTQKNEAAVDLISEKAEAVR
jgi:hypothetical protein